MKEHGGSRSDVTGEHQPRSQGSDKLEGMNLGLRVLSYLISGVALYGLLGWVGDRFLGTSFLLPVGIVLGAALGVFVIIRRFGRVDDAAKTPVAVGAMKQSHTGREGMM